MRRTFAQNRGDCARNRLTGFTDGCLEPADELGQRNAHCSADASEFHEIQSTLARLVLADEGLRLVKSLGQFGLSQTHLKPEIPEQGLQVFLFIGEGTSWHVRIMTTLTTYPKMGYSTNGGG